jgi:hypothetical protein
MAANLTLTALLAPRLVVTMTDAEVCPANSQGTWNLI